MLLALLQLGLITVWVACFLILLPRGAGSFDEPGGFAMLVAAAYVLIYVGLPSGAFHRTTHSLRGRILVRCSVPILILAASFLPSLLGFLVRDRGLMEFEHPGHPFWLMSELFNENINDLPGGVLSLFVGVLALAGVAMLINAWRMQAGVREVLAASAQRRELERRARSEEVDAPGQA